MMARRESLRSIAVLIHRIRWRVARWLSVSKLAFVSHPLGPSQGGRPLKILTSQSGFCKLSRNQKNARKNEHC